MKHSYIDKYAKGNSILHRLDARIKLITLLLLILLIVIEEKYPFRFALYGMLVFSLIVISRIPFSFIFKRTLMIIPFVFLITFSVPFIKSEVILFSVDLQLFTIPVYEKGAFTFSMVIIKSLLSILCFILLLSTIRFNLLLKTFEWFKIPKIFILLMSFMYRYIFIISDQAFRMERARISRYFGKKLFYQFKVFGFLIANLFSRSYQKGERIYNAMISRGFTGDIKTLDTFKLKSSDIILGTALILILFGIKLVKFI